MTLNVYLLLCRPCYAYCEWPNGWAARSIQFSLKSIFSLRNLPTNHTTTLSPTPNPRHPKPTKVLHRLLHTGEYPWNNKRMPSAPPKACFCSLPFPSSSHAPTYPHDNPITDPHPIVPFLLFQFSTPSPQSPVLQTDRRTLVAYKWEVTKLC